VLSFSLNSRNFFIFFLISSMAHSSWRNMLFSL
jgi:hypothetical protein